LEAQNPADAQLFARCAPSFGTRKTKTVHRFPLEAADISEAKEQLEIKRNDRRKDKLPASGFRGEASLVRRA